MKLSMQSWWFSFLVTVILHIAYRSEDNGHNEDEVIRPIHAKRPKRVFLFVFLSLCVVDESHFFPLSLARQLQPPSSVGLLTWHVNFYCLMTVSFDKSWFDPSSFSISLIYFDHHSSFYCYQSFGVWWWQRIQIFFKGKERFYCIVKLGKCISIPIPDCNWYRFWDFWSILCWYGAQ